MGLTPHPSCSIPSGFDAFGAFGASFTSARVQLMTSVNYCCLGGVIVCIWCCWSGSGCRIKKLDLQSRYVGRNLVSCYTRLHRESKNKTPNSWPYLHQLISDFQIFFTSWLGSKFARNTCLNIPPRFNRVATLPCEIWMHKNGIIVKYVLQLMMNHKVV